MATGIIAEYNPFHKGHMYHIKETKKITDNDIVVIMSGNFVQRGEPAMTDKHTRAKMALRNGVSLVIELPVEYATGSADVFAKGAVNILDATRIIDTLSFGSERGSTDIFDKISDILNNEPNTFKELIKSYLNSGLSYPSARTKALEEYMSLNLDFMNRSNNILALEYIRQLKKLQSSIKPVTVERIVSEYNSRSLSGEISSASAIRSALINKDLSALNSVPQNCIDLIKDKNIPQLNDYTSILSYILCTRSPSEISEYADITEGLENRILNTDFNSIDELITKVKTKRYTYSKLQKAILHIILGITKKEQQADPKYIRVLGFRKDKKYLLKELTEKASLPVIMNVKENESPLKREIISTDIYNIPLNKKRGIEYTTPLVTE